MISIIIPTRNRSNKLEDCLNSIFSQNDKGYELIVVNDGATDNTSEILSSFMEKHNNMKIIENKKSMGSYYCRNKAVEVADGGILAFTDDDCIVESDWITEIKSAFEEVSIEAVQGIAYLASNRGFWVKLESARLKNDSNYFWTDTKNFAVRKKVFEEIGNFDLSYKSGGDAEYGIRLIRQNKKLVFSEKIKVYHYWKNNPIELLAKEKTYAYGDFLTFNKHREPPLKKCIRDTIYIPRIALALARKNKSLKTIEKIIAVPYIASHLLIRFFWFYWYLLNN